MKSKLVWVLPVAMLWAQTLGCESGTIATPATGDAGPIGGGGGILDGRPGPDGADDPGNAPGGGPMTAPADTPTTDQDASPDAGPTTAPTEPTQDPPAPDASVPGMMDAKADAGMPADAGSGRSCANQDYLLCLDFEDTAVGDIPTGWSKAGDPVSVADDQVYRGERSLKIGAIPSWRRRIEHSAEMIGPEHWGRVFYRVQQPVPDAFVHSSHVTFTGVGPNVGAAEYRYFDTIKAAADANGIENRIQFIFNVQPKGAEFGSGTGWLPRYYEDAWHCAEWHVNAANQSYAFYLDGELLHEFQNGAGNYDETEIPDSYQTVSLGWTNYQEAPPGFTAWYDDFALDDARIGCD